MTVKKKAPPKGKAKAKAAKPKKKKEGPGQVVGSRVASAKLDDKKVKTIKSRLKKGDSLAEIARDYNVSRRTITCIREGITWGHVK